MSESVPGTEEAAPRGYPSDVAVVTTDDREFVLVGTAHVSRESADLVRRVIETERPDCVCIELDRQRYEALSQKHRFEALDLKEIIRNRQLSTLLINLILAAYQKQLGATLGVMPGTELLEAGRVAGELGVPIALCDREVRVTLRRAWGALTLWRKLGLFASLFGTLFERPELSEEDLRALRQQDVVSKLMGELGEQFPALKSVLIDERDGYLARKIESAAGRRIVAVIGAGHVDGIRRALVEGKEIDVAALEVVPPASAAWKWIGWAIPALILGAIALIGWQKGPAAAGDNALFWVLVHGVPSLLGAAIALAHPVTAIVAFAVAPFTSLTPVIGAGYVAAFTQVFFRPPRVHEFQSVSEDLRVPRRWWGNRLLRIFLVFLLVSLGSAFGTLVGGAKIFSSLFY